MLLPGAVSLELLRQVYAPSRRLGSGSFGAVTL